MHSLGHYVSFMFPHYINSKHVCLPYGEIGSCWLSVVLVDTVDQYMDHTGSICRPNIQQVMTNTRLIHLLTVSWVSVKGQSSVSWVSVKYWSICWPICVSLKCRLGNGPHIDENSTNILYLINIQPILNRHSTNCQLRYQCPPILAEHINKIEL